MKLPELDVAGTLTSAREYAQLWLGMMVDGTNELGKRMRARLAIFAALLLVGILISALVPRLAWRAPMMAVLASVTFVLATQFAVRDVRWFVTTGAVVGGLRAISPDAVEQLRTLNPFLLIFHVAERALTGGLGLFWVYAQIMMKIGFYASLAFGYMCLSFWHQPWLLSIVPIAVLAYVTLGVAYTKESRGPLWRFWIFLVTAAVAIVAVLTVFPGFTGWAGTAGVVTTLAMIAGVGGILYLGVTWASGQHAGRAGRSGGSGVRGGGWNRSQVGELVLGVLQIGLLAAVIAWAFAGCYRDSDGFRKVVGLQGVFERVGSIYPIPLRGTSALPSASTASVGSGTASLDGDLETVSYPVRFELTLGPMEFPVKVTGGDRVRVTVSPTSRTYRVLDEPSHRTVPIAGFFRDGQPSLPQGELLDRYRNDYPHLGMAEGGLLVQDGTQGGRWYIGVDGEFVIPAPGRARTLRFFLNLPQRRELMGYIPPGQFLDLTVSITRSR